MEIRSEKIERMFKGDFWLVIILSVSIIAVISYVLLNVLQLIGQKTVMVMFVTISVIACLAMLWGLVMVVRHLRRNKIELYSEEINNTVKNNKI